MASDDQKRAPTRRDVIRAGLGAAMLTAIPAGVRRSVAKYRLEPDARYLDAAIRAGRWLQATAIDAPGGKTWPAVPPDAKTAQVNLYSGSPDWSASFLNELVGLVIRKYTSLYDTTEAQQFYRTQLDLLAKRVDEAQTALNAFRERVGVELLTLNADQLRERISALEQSRATAKTEIAELRARQAAPDAMLAEGGTVDPVSPATTGSGVQSIKARIVELEIKRGELLSRYAPKSGMISDVNHQIAEARRLLAQEQRVSADLYRKEAETRIEAADARFEAFGEQLHEYRETLAEVETIAPEWERLQSDLETQRSAYQTYLRKEEEARVSNALDDSDILNVAVAQTATVPRDPEASPVIKLVALGAGMALILGVGLALLRDWLDPSVKTTSQAERMTGIPVLGEIPL